MEECDPLTTSLGQMFSENGHDLATSFLEDLVAKIKMAPRVSYLRINTLCGDKSHALKVLENLLAEWEWPSRPRLSESHPFLSIHSAGPASVKPQGGEVVVSLECGQSVLRGADVYAAGVLGIERDLRTGDRVSVWTDCANKCTRGLKTRYDSRDKIFIGNGVLKMARDVVFGEHKSSGLAVAMQELEWRSPSFDRLSESLFYPQNLPSILAVEELEPSASMVVLDMCASPGGKTSHIAANMKNQGIILAFDKNKNKVDKLERTLRRNKATGVRAFVADSTRLCASESVGGVSPESFEAGRRLLPNSFDRILLDPPCSAIGQRPSLRPKVITATSRASFAAYQRRLLEVAMNLLRPGGRLVYSTCTLNPEENEANVSFALSRGLVLIPPKCKFGSPGLPICGIGADNSLLLKRFWPTDEEDTVAFFYAVLEKPLIESRA